MDVALLDGPIDTTTVIERLSQAGARTVGAMVSFAGVVRADGWGDGPVERIEFECYP